MTWIVGSICSYCIRTCWGGVKQGIKVAYADVEILLLLLAIALVLFTYAFIMKDMWSCIIIKVSRSYLVPRMFKECDFDALVFSLPKMWTFIVIDL
jgi:hypothetical protein